MTNTAPPWGRADFGRKAEFMTKLFSHLPAYFGETTEAVRADGFTFTARLMDDAHHGAPWEEEDGHGPVLVTRRAKQPGELALGETGCNRAKRFYDFAQACRIARRDGWNAEPYSDSETPRQRAAKAARADFDRLAAYCRDEWSYCGVVVECWRGDRKLGWASLWGIESDARAYLIEVANELAEEAEASARAFLATLADA
jgi:hypothetical protein